MLKGELDEFEEKDEDNLIKIAGRDFAVYNQTILDKLQKHDQIEICVTDRYFERAMHIIRQWEAVGIVPDNKDKKIEFKTKQEEITIKGTTKKMQAIIHRIVLTKQPELYRFTKN